MTRTKYRFFEDPGHGWLEVPYCDLDSAGVADKISGYSYQSQDGWLVYLEEDCDLTTFGRAIGWQPGQWDEFVSETVYHEDNRIRGLPHYRVYRDVFDRIALTNEHGRRALYDETRPHAERVRELELALGHKQEG